MKTYMNLLLVILVLFVTQPNTGQCGPTEIKILQQIHCELITANVQREERQNDVRCRRKGHDWSCYKIVTKKLNYYPARQFCFATGTDLVSIESSGERDFLASALTDLNRGCKNFLTSGRKHHGTWKWLATWGKLYYKSWSVNQPSGNGDYLYVWNRHTPAWGTWDDAPDLKDCFVCERRIKLPSYCS